jgi:hypothetical protein
MSAVIERAPVERKGLKLPHVRFGSKADLTVPKSDFRYPPKTGRRSPAVFSLMKSLKWKMLERRHGVICLFRQRQNWIIDCDKTTRRANHQKSVQPLPQKYFA